jgi:hypothetical protein
MTFGMTGGDDVCHLFSEMRHPKLRNFFVMTINHKNNRCF